MRILICAALLLTSVQCYADAFDELNAQRAHWGFPPLIERADLTRRAQAKAEWQAAHDISLKNGYNGHEGIMTPPHLSEGTGVADPMWGWMSCRDHTLGSLPAGAGMAIGTNGKRYMCLIIGAPSNRCPQRETGQMYSNTSHLTNDAPIIPRSSFVPPRQPVGRWFSPRPYYRQLTREWEAANK